MGRGKPRGSGPTREQRLRHNVICSKPADEIERLTIQRNKAWLALTTIEKVVTDGDSFTADDLADVDWCREQDIDELTEVLEKHLWPEEKEAV